MTTQYPQPPTYIRKALAEGLVIPAHPLALTPKRGSMSNGSAHLPVIITPPEPAGLLSAYTPPSSRYASRNSNSWSRCCRWLRKQSLPAMP